MEEEVESPGGAKAVSYQVQKQLVAVFSKYGRCLSEGTAYPGREKQRQEIGSLGGYIFLFLVVTRPCLYGSHFIGTCLLINFSFVQSSLIGFLPLSSKRVLTP